MNLRNLKYFFILASIVGFVACKDDDDDDDGEMTGTQGKNKTIMNEFAYSNNAEIDMGQLASTKGSDSIVKAYGMMMVTDHQKAKKELDSIAVKRNFTLATDLKAADKSLRDSINGLSGAAFDRAYMMSQVNMHNRVKTMFTAFRDSSSDAALKTFVNKYLPKIEDHWEKADSIADELGTGGTGGGNDTTGTGGGVDTTGTGGGVDTTGTGGGVDTTGNGNDTTALIVKRAQTHTVAQVIILKEQYPLKEMELAIRHESELALIKEQNVENEDLPV